MNRIVKNTFVITQKILIATFYVVCILPYINSGCTDKTFSDESVFSSDGNELESIALRAKEGDSPYYFYNHLNEMVYLSLNTNFAFLSTKEYKLPADIMERGIIATELQSDNIAKMQFLKNPGESRFYTELSFKEELSEEQYLALLVDIKRSNPDIIIAPYFKMKDDDKTTGGLSKFLLCKVERRERCSIA